MIIKFKRANYIYRDEDFKNYNIHSDLQSQINLKILKGTVNIILSLTPLTLSLSNHEEDIDVLYFESVELTTVPSYLFL